MTTSLSPAAAPITTARLALVLLLPDVLGALAERDVERAAKLQDLALPPDFVALDGSDDFFLQVQQHRHRRALPSERGWCARAIVRRRDGAVMGHCGFHGPPRAVGRAEIGYTVLPPYRGRGVATEAAQGLLRWAWEQGERSVFASVREENVASLSVVRKLGFVETGVQVDDVDGEELVFEVRAPGT